MSASAERRAEMPDDRASRVIPDGLDIEEIGVPGRELHHFANGYRFARRRPIAGARVEKHDALRAGQRLETLRIVEEKRALLHLCARLAQIGGNVGIFGIPDGEGEQVVVRAQRVTAHELLVGGLFLRELRGNLGVGVCGHVPDLIPSLGGKSQGIRSPRIQRRSLLREEMGGEPVVLVRGGARPHHERFSVLGVRSPRRYPRRAALAASGRLPRRLGLVGQNAEGRSRRHCPCLSCEVAIRGVQAQSDSCTARSQRPLLAHKRVRASLSL